MGQFLTVGICTEFSFKQNKSMNNFDSLLSEAFALNLYDKNEQDNYIKYKLKPEILTDNISNLLRRQFKLYPNTVDNIEELTDALKDKNCEEILKLASCKSFYNFQLLPYYSQYIGDTRINITMIGMFSEGKILMETYGSIFSYLEKIIHIANKDDLLAQAIKIRIME